MNQIADRYVSFIGIDCNGNARRLAERILLHITEPEKSNAFWDRFKQRLAGAEADASSRVADEMCLLCSHVSYIEELFEQYDDSEGLDLLQKLEMECC